MCSIWANVTKEGFVEYPITIKDDEVFSEPGTSVSEPPRQPMTMEARRALRFNENLQNFKNSAARQVFDLKIIWLLSCAL